MMKVVILFVAFLATSFAYPSRIVNGTDADEGEIPYIISLRNYGSHSCGGSILDATHVLTAAHCVSGASARNLQVQYGVLDIYKSDNIVQVSRVSVHENYSPSNNYANDVAVLELASPIRFSQNVSPTVLPRQGDPIPEEQPSILAGWGLEKSGGSVQRFLQRVDLKVFSANECTALLNGMTTPRYHLCSGVVGGGKGQCSGDSGGPLYSNGVQVGIVSWSIKPCARPGFPGVFTRVSNYVDWISERTRA